MKKIPELDKLLVAESFRMRTAMYIGDNKISTLKSFIDGVEYAMDVYEIEKESPLEGFHDWVADYYGWYESTAGWKNVILRESGESEERALKEFFSLYDKFLSEQKSA